MSDVREATVACKVTVGTKASRSQVSRLEIHKLFLVIESVSLEVTHQVR